MYYKDITFVIPSNREHIHTTQSNHFDNEIIIATEIPLGNAINHGIQKATTDWIVLCDDDIKFSVIFLSHVMELMNENMIVGLEAYYPSPYVIGRFMAFHKSAYDIIGPFVSQHHGTETDWCIRAVEKGYEIVRLSRKCVYHYPHEKYKPVSEKSNLLWILRRHPHFFFDIIKMCKTKMKYSSYDIGEYK